MNNSLKDHDLVDLFTTQGRAVPDDAVPTTAIMGRGRSRKRRRGALTAVAAVVAIGVTGYGVRYAMRDDPQQLAVTNAGAGTTTAQASTATSTPRTTSAPSIGEATSPPVAASGPTDGETFTIDDLTVDQLNGMSFGAQPFRDGFLFPAPVDSDDPDRGGTALSFLFTTDGNEFRRLGPDLRLDSDRGSPVVVVEPDGESVSVVSVKVDASAEIHLYQSSDFVSWTDEVLEVDFDTAADLGLTPTLQRVVTPVPLVGKVAISGDRVVLTAEMFLAPSKAILDEHGMSTETAVLEDRGLVELSPETADEGGEVIVSSEDLGLTAADEDRLMQSFGQPDSLLVSVGPSGPGQVAAVDSATAHEVFTAFGNSFVHTSVPWEGEWLPPINANIQVSSDGVNWSSFEPEIGPGEQVVSIAPLDDHLLIVTSNGTEVKSYRVDPGLTTEFIGQRPIPDGYEPFEGFGNQLLRLWKTGDDAPSVEDGDGGGILFMPVGEYDVTIDLPTDENPTVHYIIVQRDTGEVVVENTVDDPNFLDGELIDGENAVRFTDAAGRPEIVISMEDMLGGSAPSDNPNIDLLTVDGGATWHEIPRKAVYSQPIAANGNKVLIEVDDDNVLDIGEVDLEVYELPE